MRVVKRLKDKKEGQMKRVEKDSSAQSFNTPMSCLNETSVKSSGLQREYSSMRSSYCSGPIFQLLSDSVPLRDPTRLDGWKQVETETH